MKSNEFEPQGDRFRALLAEKWPKQGEAAAALGITQGAVSSLCKKRVISPSSRLRYWPVLEANDLNPAYVDDPYAPKRLSEVRAIEASDEKVAIALSQIESMRARLASLEASLRRSGKQAAAV